MDKPRRTKGQLAIIAGAICVTIALGGCDALEREPVEVKVILVERYRQTKTGVYVLRGDYTLLEEIESRLRWQVRGVLGEPGDVFMWTSDGRESDRQIGG